MCPCCTARTVESLTCMFLMGKAIVLKNNGDKVNFIKNLINSNMGSLSSERYDWWNEPIKISLTTPVVWRLSLQSRKNKTVSMKEK